MPWVSQIRALSIYEDVVIESKKEQVLAAKSSQSEAYAPFATAKIEEER